MESAFSVPPREAIVAEARRWLGTPYRHQGRTREGCDCLGLVVGVAAELGLAEWRVPGYSGHPDGSLERACAEHLVVRDKMEPGMVALLWYARRRMAQHLAILSRLDDGRLGMLHSLQRNGEVVEHSLNPFWSARMIATFDLPGLEDIGTRSRGEDILSVLSAPSAPPRGQS